MSTLLTAGCAVGTRTTWDVRGSYQARYTHEDGTVELVSFGA